MESAQTAKPIPTFDVFISYSNADSAAASTLRDALRSAGLSVFFDQASIRDGENWMQRLEQAIANSGSFVVLVGIDGVRRWVGAETQVALTKHFGPHDDASRIPIYPVLLESAEPDALPALLSLFQAARWAGPGPVPIGLIKSICGSSEDAALHRLPLDGSPYVGLDAFRPDQAHLFFGRQRETLEALACFNTRTARQAVRWLQVDGNSGTGKSSLVLAGLLPLIEQGWLWRPNSSIKRWKVLGPVVPGERPVERLAQHLAQAAREIGESTASMAKVLTVLRETDDDAGLRFWLMDRQETNGTRTGFVLAIDQFEELFTYEDSSERQAFDRLVAESLKDPTCPLWMISTVRSDFLDRFESFLPALTEARNRCAATWTLGQVSGNALGEVIEGPARLAAVDVSEVMPLLLSDARNEAGSLPLIENALHFLWERRDGNRLLAAEYVNNGKLAGILSRGADALIDGLPHEARETAMSLLLSLVNADQHGLRHTRRKISLSGVLSGGRGNEDKNHRLVIDTLAGVRNEDIAAQAGPLRLITLDADGDTIDLIHETLVRCQNPDAESESRPYWPRFWNYIERNKSSLRLQERLRLQADEWDDDRTLLGRWFGLAGRDAWKVRRTLISQTEPMRSYLRRSCWVFGVQTLVAAILIAGTLLIVDTYRQNSNRTLLLKAAWEHLNEGEYSAAESPLDELRKSYSDDYLVANVWGAFYFFTSNFPEAIQSFRLCISLSPPPNQRERCNRNLADAYIASGEYGKVLNQYLREPTSTSYDEYILGRARFFLNDFDDAVKHLESIQNRDRISKGAPHIYLAASYLGKSMKDNISPGEKDELQASSKKELKSACAIDNKWWNDLLSLRKESHKESFELVSMFLQDKFQSSDDICNLVTS